jgi:hypothetical protein
MTKITSSDRPNWEEILENKYLWALNKDEFDFNEELEKISEIGEINRDLLNELKNESYFAYAYLD